MRHLGPGWEGQMLHRRDQKDQRMVAGRMVPDEWLKVGCIGDEHAQNRPGERFEHMYFHFFFFIIFSLFKTNFKFKYILMIIFPYPNFVHILFHSLPS